MLAIAILIYQPAWFWYVTMHFPRDVARAVAYCLVAPLAVIPSAYRTVLGLGQGKSSFFNKSVNSINTLMKFGGMFLLLASLAISASQCSPFRTAPVTMVSAPAFPNATSAPNVLNVSLPFRGPYLPTEIDAGGGIVHSYNTSLLVDACSVANFSDPEVEDKTSRAISTLPVAGATVDSGASAHCTFDCGLLFNTKPCDEVFGAANGVLAQATVIGSLPLIARAEDGQFIHLVITNVRCVPEFSNFTLLSVDQMWEEQRIKSSFCDEKQLLLPKCSGGYTIPYDLAAGRNTLKFASAVQLYDLSLIHISEPTRLV